MATVKIGGVSFSGSNLDIIGGKVYIDGREIEQAALSAKDGILEVRIVEGVVETLRADGNVTAGAVKGSVHAEGNVTCDCVGGSVHSEGNVRCGRVGGSITAEGNVRHA